MTPGETLRGAGVRRWLYDPKIRALAAQLLTILAIVLFAGWIVHNTVHNLTVRGIASGFGFLNNPAGFGILQTLIDYISHVTIKCPCLLKRSQPKKNSPTKVDSRKNAIKPSIASGAPNTSPT